MKYLMLLIVLFWGCALQAIEFSAYRIFLDKDSRSQQFSIFNESQGDEICTLKTRHHVYQKDGTTSIWQEDTLPKNSALTLLRYSPKKFTIPAGSRQVVNFVKRRKANITEGEYQSILSINCNSVQQNNSNQQVQLVANIVHNIPIIVREGVAEGNVEIKNVKINENKVSVELIPSGKRSFYGELSFQNESGDILTKHPHVGIHIGVESKLVKIDLPNSDEDMWLVFTEYEQFGGTVTTKTKFN